MTKITLTGLRADNPLAFLAALGTLRVLTLAEPDDPPRMGWTMHGGAWRPVLAWSRTGDPDTLVTELARALTRKGGRAAFDFADDTCTKPDIFRTFVQQAACDATLSDRRMADFAAAFGCEVFLDDQGRVCDTALRTMSGAGNQHFLAFMRTLCENTEETHLREALFGPWRYQDPPPSMRWDPVDDRRYALRWRNPSREKITTVRGANRLAIEALPLFVVVPDIGGVETVAFDRKTWTWPVWEPYIPLEPVASLLAMVHSNAFGGERVKREERGIVAMFSAERVSVGKYRNFSPARAVE